MEQYSVTGMSCAACSSRIEKAVLGVEGVTNCSVSLLTNSMGVEGTASKEAIIKAVVDAGYGASLKNSKDNKTDYDEELEDNETPKLKRRLIASVIILLPLMYVSMGHMLWHLPLPIFLQNNHIGIGLYEMLLTIIVMIINQKFFVSGFKGLANKAANMDTLVALGAGAAFIYSVFSLFTMTFALSKGDSVLVSKYADELYFESAATILTLITVGKTLEARAKGKTTDALKGLMKLAPKTAVILKDGKEVTIPIENLAIGDHFTVKPGETVAVDGIVIEGASAIDESALTGESIPVDKKIGDKVSAATINQSGYLVCEATRVGEDTTLSQIIQMVKDAATTKAPIAKLADKISGIFVPAVISIAVITFIIWLIAGQSVGFSLARAISVLVISCPCALGLATPVAIMVANGHSAKSGILFKTAVSLEETGRVQIVALDKTGTITKGEPRVANIITASDISENELLKYAYSLEQKSEHPLAKAIVVKANEAGLKAESISEFKAEAGNGLRGSLTYENNKAVILIGGKQEYIEKTVTLTKEMKDKAAQEAELGHTPLFFARDNELLGIISVADSIKEDSAEAIERLKKLGVHVVMLTGDNERTARAIGKEAGVHEVVAGVLPDGKQKVIEALQEKGKVAMVGDGINDAPALTKADIGIAIGAGTDVAIDAADIVLMKSSLKDAVAAIQMSRGTLKNIKENLFWAFFYNIIGIPLAAGFWIPIFGWTLNPMFGAAAMGLSSFCVVTNALRLNLFDIYDKRKDKSPKGTLGEEPLLSDFIKNNINNKEEKKMTLNVNGMMCGHCEAHVKKALEAIEGVVEATANHETNTVEVKTDRDVDLALMKSAIIDAGYEFVE